MRIGTFLPPSRPIQASAAPPATTTFRPLEPVDQSLLEAGREVALLPILDPAVCATVMMAAVIGGMGGGAGLAAAAPTLKAVLDGRVAQVNYDFDRQGMDARGTVDERTVAETVRPVGSDRVRLFGRFGAVQENILVKLTDHGLRLTGKANGLEIDLQYSLGWQNRQVDQNPLPGQAQTWCDVRGTVGGLPYKAQASLAPSLERGDGLAQVLVEGQLGDQKINKSYALRTDPEIERVVMEGSGQVAGAEQSLRVEIGLSAAGMEAFLAG